MAISFNFAANGGTSTIASPITIPLDPVAAAKFVFALFVKDSSGGAGNVTCTFGGSPLTFIQEGGVSDGRYGSLHGAAADIPDEIANGVIAWDGGGAHYAIAGLYSADGDIQVVPYEVGEVPVSSSDTANNLTVQLPCLAGDVMVGCYLSNSSNQISSSTNAQLRHALAASGSWQIWDQIVASDGDAIITIGHGATPSPGTLIVFRLRNVAPPPNPIEATYGDADVAYGQDPGFAGNVNGANLKTSDDSYSLALALGTSSINTAPTFDLPTFEDIAYETDWPPLPTVSHSQLQIEITSDNGGDTAVVRDINLSLPAGFEIVELASVSTALGSVFYGLAAPETAPPDTSQLVYPVANNTSIASDGVITTDQNGGFLHCWLWRSDIGKIELMDVYLPGQLALANLPGSMEPSTQYSIDVQNGTSVADAVVIVDSGTDYVCTVDSANLTSITFTTPANLPGATPSTNMRVNFPTP